jgi:hypothetical protein
MFLAGGNTKEDQDEGLPGSFAARREACIDEAGARGTEASQIRRGNKVEGERTMSQGEQNRRGTKSKRENKFDVQTAVQDR